MPKLDVGDDFLLVTYLSQSDAIWQSGSGLTLGQVMVNVVIDVLWLKTSWLLPIVAWKWKLSFVTNFWSDKW